MSQAATLTRANPHKRAIEVAESHPEVLEDPIVQLSLRQPIPAVAAENETAPAPTASERAYGGATHKPPAPTASEGAHEGATDKPVNRAKQASALSRLSEAGSALLDQVVISATAFLDRMPGFRKLTAKEIAQHRKVFGNAIDFSAARMLEVGPVLLEGMHGGITLGNYMILIGDWKSEADVAHELTHVWQSQNGRYFKYIPEAVPAIVDGEEGYDWELGMNAGQSWSQLNPEQQAKYISDKYYRLEAADEHEAPVVCGTPPKLDSISKSSNYLDQARYDLQCGIGAPGRRPKPSPTRR